MAIMTDGQIQTSRLFEYHVHIRYIVDSVSNERPMALALASQFLILYV